MSGQQVLKSLRDKRDDLERLIIAYEEFHALRYVRRPALAA